MQRNGLATTAAIEAIYRDRFHEFVRVAEAICRDADSARPCGRSNRCAEAAEQTDMASSPSVTVP
jgi:hypothetical protein